LQKISDAEVALEEGGIAHQGVAVEHHLALDQNHEPVGEGDQLVDVLVDDDAGDARP
jgi:hypothetical protein